MRDGGVEVENRGSAQEEFDWFNQYETFFQESCDLPNLNLLIRGGTGQQAAATAATVTAASATTSAPATTAAPPAPAPAALAVLKYVT